MKQNPNIECINQAIRKADKPLNDELWIRGSTDRAKVLKKRLNELRRNRDNGELYEVRF